MAMATGTEPQSRTRIGQATGTLGKARAMAKDIGIGQALGTLGKAVGIVLRAGILLRVRLVSCPQSR